MNKKTAIMFAGVAAATAGFAASSATADSVRLNYDIANGSGSGFAFSVLHVPSIQRGEMGWGSVAFRMVGTFSLDYDASAGTVEFAAFDATLFNETNLNPNLGSEAGTFELVSSDVFGINGDDLVEGDATFRMSLGSGTQRGVQNSSGEVTVRFKAIAYNPLVNKLDPDTLQFGLWGATADVFGEAGQRSVGDTGFSRLGMDLLGNAPTVPMPSALGMAGIGLGGLGFGGATRRRRKA